MIEKILNEISRLKKELKGYSASEALDYIESYINTTQEESSEDLEDAAYHFCMDEYGNPKESLFEFDQRCFKAGAEWQKQQMMKDAVDATIFSELKSSDGSLFQAKSDRFRMNGVKISDRIKVIPIKTEQQ